MKAWPVVVLFFPRLFNRRHSLLCSKHLSNEGRGSGGLAIEKKEVAGSVIEITKIKEIFEHLKNSLFPVGRNSSGQAVVASQAVDLALDQNKTELAILVLPVLLQMLADVDCLLDKLVQVLGEIRAESVGLEDTDNFVSSHILGLGNSVGITEDDANLRGGQTLLGELADLVDNLSGGGLEP